MTIADPQPIGSLLDGLGITASIAPDELLAGAIVILKVLQPDGRSRLGVSNSEALGVIDRAGMLNLATGIEMAKTTDRHRPGA